MNGPSPKLDMLFFTEFCFLHLSVFAGGPYCTFCFILACLVDAKFIVYPTGQSNRLNLARKDAEVCSSAERFENK